MKSKALTFKKKIFKSIAITIILIAYLNLFNSCNLFPTSKIEEIKVDTTPVVIKTKFKVPLRIDSIKMHAFDNVFFGINEDITQRLFSINNIEFNIGEVQYIENGQLCYFTIESNEKITTQKRANKIINDLKNTISKKYSKSLFLNKTFYVKHPEENAENENTLDIKNIYAYDKNTIGLPYEFLAYKWDLAYKEIQIGYIIDYKNRSRYMQSTPQNDYYIVYLKFNSKILRRNNDNVTNNISKKDFNKF